MISRGLMAKAGCSAPTPPGERGDHLVIRAAPGRRVDRLRRELEMLVAAGGVEVVVLEKHGRRQHDVGVPRGVGQKLLVHADEQIVARKAAPHLLLMRGDRQRIGVLDRASP